MKRHADPVSWARTIAKNREMDPDTAMEIMNNIRAAYQRMREGNGDDEDFDTLAATLNVGLMRAEKIGQPVVDSIDAGLCALVSADRRKELHGRYGFNGEGVIAMNAALDLYQDMLKLSTPGQMDAALQESMRRMRAGEIRA